MINVLIGEVSNREAWILSWEPCLWGHQLFPTPTPKCFKLDSSLFKFEYVKDHTKYGVVIRLGTGWGVDLVRPVTRLVEDFGVPWSRRVAMRMKRSWVTRNFRGRMGRIWWLLGYESWRTEGNRDDSRIPDPLHSY